MKVSLLITKVQGFSSERTFLYYDSKLRIIPRKMTFRNILSFFYSHPKFINTLFHMPKKVSFKVKENPITLKEYCEKRNGIGKWKPMKFNHFIRKYFIDSMMTGIYGFPSKDLSLNICNLKTYEKDFFGIVLLSFIIQDKNQRNSIKKRATKGS